MTWASITSTAALLLLAVAVLFPRAAPGAGKRNRRLEEDKVLEALRRRLIGEAEAALPAEPAVDGAATAEEADSAFEDADLNIIMKIVQVAEAKAEKERERKRAAMLQTELSRRATTTAGNVLTTSGDGKPSDAGAALMMDITGHKCDAPADCTEACHRGCEREAVQRTCERECAAECSNVGVDAATATATACPRAGKSKASKAAATACKAAAAAGGGARGCSVACQSKCAARRTEEIANVEKNCRAASRGECQAQCATGGSYAAALSHAAGDWGDVFDPSSCLEQCQAEFVSRCRLAKGGECQERCGRHVCVAGACACPVFYSGDTQCGAPMELAAMLPERYQHCVVPFTDSRFKKRAGPNATVLDLHDPNTAALAHKFSRSRVLNSGRAPSENPDLSELADWSRCAVVGSSSSLLGAGLGPEVDNHTAVIRFNDAPTEAYEADVGSKTSLRIQNVMYCGYHEKRKEICMHYTGWRGNTCSMENRRKYAGCNFASMSYRMLRYVRDYLAPAQGDNQLVKKDCSAGFFGVLTALHLCGTVDIYGFTQSSRHYFPKHTRSKSSFGEKHSWRLERACLAVISSLPQVQRRR